MNNIVIGGGEVGLTLLSIISVHHNCGLVDLNFRENIPQKQIDIMHVAIPYSKDFVKIVNSYITEFDPRIVIIESTVAVGTCRKIQSYWKFGIYHSPVRGRHKTFRKHLLSFIKYYSGDKVSNGIDSYFGTMGIKTKYFDKFETTELGKLLSTAQYGMNLIFADEMKRICNKFGISYEEAVEHFNSTYNQGYKDTQFQRSVLNPPNKKIGGHCVVQNAKILRDQVKSADLDAIIEYE